MDADVVFQHFFEYFAYFIMVIFIIGVFREEIIEFFVNIKDFLKSFKDIFKE